MVYFFTLLNEMPQVKKVRDVSCRWQHEPEPSRDTTASPGHNELLPLRSQQETVIIRETGESARRPKSGPGPFTTLPCCRRWRRNMAGSGESESHWLCRDFRPSYNKTVSTSATRGAWQYHNTAYVHVEVRHGLLSVSHVVGGMCLMSSRRFTNHSTQFHGCRKG